MNAQIAKQRLCYILAADRVMTNTPPSRLHQCYVGRNSQIFDWHITVLSDETVRIGYNRFNDQGAIEITKAM